PPYLCLLPASRVPRALHPFPTRRSSDLPAGLNARRRLVDEDRDIVGADLEETDRFAHGVSLALPAFAKLEGRARAERDEDRIVRSEEHTSELQSRENLVCRLLLEKKKKK